MESNSQYVDLFHRFENPVAPIHQAQRRLNLSVNSPLRGKIYCPKESRPSSDSQPAYPLWATGLPPGAWPMEIPPPSRNPSDGHGHRDLEQGGISLAASVNERRPRHPLCTTGVEQSSDRGVRVLELPKFIHPDVREIDDAARSMETAGRHDYASIRPPYNPGTEATIWRVAMESRVRMIRRPPTDFFSILKAPKGSRPKSSETANSADILNPTERQGTNFHPPLSETKKPKHNTSISNEKQREADAIVEDAARCLAGESSAGGRPVEELNIRKSVLICRNKQDLICDETVVAKIWKAEMEKKAELTKKAEMARIAEIIEKAETIKKPEVVKNLGVDTTEASTEAKNDTETNMIEDDFEDLCLSDDEDWEKVDQVDEEWHVLKPRRKRGSVSSHTYIRVVTR